MCGGQVYMKEEGGLSEGGEEREDEEEGKREKVQRGEDEKRVEGVEDQHKMENSGSVALENRTMQKEVERKTGEVRYNVLPYVQRYQVVSGSLPCLQWSLDSFCFQS